MDHKAQIMAAAYTAAAALGTNAAVELLKAAIQRLTDDQWNR